MTLNLTRAIAHMLCPIYRASPAFNLPVSAPKGWTDTYANQDYDPVRSSPSSHLYWEGSQVTNGRSLISGKRPYHDNYFVMPRTTLNGSNVFTVGTGAATVVNNGGYADPAVDGAGLKFACGATAGGVAGTSWVLPAIPDSIAICMLTGVGTEFPSVPLSP